MTDKKFMDLIDKTQKALREYSRLKELAEKEYERRYGHNPSDIDDDYWIDSVHYGPIPMTLIEIEKNAKQK